MRIKMNYIKQESRNEMVKYLKEFIDSETIIINIGTDRCIGDSVAPLLGMMLHKSNFPLKVYGTLKDPVHAINLENKLKEIKLKHPNSKIIGIDACLGDEESVGEIQIRDVCISPGKGVGKSLPQVGDISIIGIVDVSDSDVIFTSRNIRLNFIYEMAETIHSVLIESVKNLSVEEEIASAI